MLDRSDVLAKVGAAILRYSLVLFFIGFGLYKFTPQEAAAIQPLMANSPFFSWLYGVFSVRGASNFIGVIEIAAGLLIVLRRWFPLLSAIGSLMCAFALLGTLSFLFTTPHIDGGTQGFLIKDLTLLGAALWTAGEALAAAKFRQVQTAGSLA